MFIITELGIGKFSGKIMNSSTSQRRKKYFPEKNGLSGDSKSSGILSGNHRDFWLE